MIFYVHNTFKRQYFEYHKCVFICSIALHTIDVRIFLIIIHFFNSIFFLVSIQIDLVFKLYWQRKNCNSVVRIEIYMKLYRHLINFQLYLIEMILMVSVIQTWLYIFNWVKFLPSRHRSQFNVNGGNVVKLSALDYDFHKTECISI